MQVNHNPFNQVINVAPGQLPTYDQIYSCLSPKGYAAVLNKEDKKVVELCKKKFAGIAKNNAEAINAMKKELSRHVSIVKQEDGTFRCIPHVLLAQAAFGWVASEDINSFRDQIKYSIANQMRAEDIKRAPVKGLPTDVMRLIFGCLTGPELAQAQRTCKEWNKLGAEEQFWKRNLQRDLEIDPAVHPSKPAKEVYQETYQQIKPRRVVVLPPLPIAAQPAPFAYAPAAAAAYALPPMTRMEDISRENDDWFHGRGAYLGLDAEQADRVHMQRTQEIDRRHGVVHPELDRFAQQTHDWFYRSGRHSSGKKKSNHRSKKHI